MAADTICSDFGPQKIKSDTVSTVSPSISHEVMGPDAMVLVFWMLSFKPTFSLSFSLSSKDSSVIFHFLPLGWCYLHIWGYSLSQYAVSHLLCVSLRNLLSVSGTHQALFYCSLCDYSDLCLSNFSLDFQRWFFFSLSFKSQKLKQHISLHAGVSHSPKPSLLHVLILCYTKQNLYFFLISLFP